MPRKKEEEQFMETAPMASATQTQTQVVSITRTKMGIAVAFLGFAALAAAAAGGAGSSNPCLSAPEAKQLVAGQNAVCKNQKLEVWTGPVEPFIITIRGFNSQALGVFTNGNPDSATLQKGATATEFSYSGKIIKVVFDGINSKHEALLYVAEIADIATCIDSDGGVNYGTKGTVSSSTVNNKGVTDYCTPWTPVKLIEYSCEGNVASSTAYNCYTEGKICQDGACVVSSTIPTTSTPATSTFSNDAILKVEKVTTDNNIKLLNGVQQKIATFGFLSLYNDTKIFGLSLEKEVTGSCSFSNWTLKDNDIVKGGDFLISESDSLVNSYYVYFEDVDQYIFPANIPKVLSVYADVNNISAGEECIIKLTMQPNTSFATYAKEVKGLPLYVVRTN